MIPVIASTSSSTVGFLTLIFAIGVFLAPGALRVAGAAAKGRDHNGRGGARQADGRRLETLNTGRCRTSMRFAERGLLTGRPASPRRRQIRLKRRNFYGEVTCSLQIDAYIYIRFQRFQ